VGRVIAINAYDYDRGRGVRRSSLTANLLFGLNDVPVLGGTFMRLRQYPIVKNIFEGGVSRKGSLPPALLREMYEVGNRRGHYRAFMSLLRHGQSWERAREQYTRIQVPVLLIYGAEDWSRPEEREGTLKAIAGARMSVIAGAGHFLSLDTPDALVTAILEFSGVGPPR
jgi:pimeloyl-ACP methyl ester carboxylesterase